MLLPISDAGVRGDGDSAAGSGIERLDEDDGVVAAGGGQARSGFGRGRAREDGEKWARANGCRTAEEFEDRGGLSNQRSASGAPGAQFPQQILRP